MLGWGKSRGGCKKKSEETNLKKQVFPCQDGVSWEKAGFAAGLTQPPLQSPHSPRLPLHRGVSLPWTMSLRKAGPSLRHLRSPGLRQPRRTIIKRALNTELMHGGMCTLVHPQDNARYLRSRTHPKEQLGYSDSLEMCEALQSRSFQMSEQSGSFQKAVYQRQMLRPGPNTHFSVGTGAFLRQILRCLRTMRIGR